MENHITFQKYVEKNINQEIKNKLFEMYKKINLETLLNNVLIVIKKKNNKLKYMYLLETMIEHYVILENQQDYTNDRNEIELLLRGFYELDNEIGNVVVLEKNMNDEEFQKNLLLLDNDFNKYLEIVKKYIGLFKFKKSHLLYFITFAKLIYLFNGYQAPSTPNIHEAILCSYDPQYYINKLLDELTK